MARVVRAPGAPVHGCRLRAETPSAAALPSCRAAIDAEFVGGAFTPALLDGGIEIVAISPGLSPRAAT